MSLINFIPASLRALPRDGIVFYLVSLGFTEAQVGLLLTLTLAGDIAISLLLTTRADQMGRRRTLIVGAPSSDRHSLLHRRGAEDRLRSDSLSAVRGDPASRGGSFIGGLDLVVKN